MIPNKINQRFFQPVILNLSLVSVAALAKQNWLFLKILFLNKK